MGKLSEPFIRVCFRVERARAPVPCPIVLRPGIFLPTTKTNNDNYILTNDK